VESGGEVLKQVTPLFLGVSLRATRWENGQKSAARPGRFGGSDDCEAKPTRMQAWASGTLARGNSGEFRWAGYGAESIFDGGRSNDVVADGG
jgi:hypothetical protein